MSIIVNLFAGPGAGKSTLAAGLFHRFKTSKPWTVELVTEFAKDLTWEGAYNTLAQHPPYLFGEQYYRIARLIGQVDVIINDSPLLLSAIYGRKMPAPWKPLVFAVFNEMKNLNFFVKRTKQYQQVGRSQDERGARKLDEKIRLLLRDSFLPYFTVESGDLDKLDNLATGCIERMILE